MSVDLFKSIPTLEKGNIVSLQERRNIRSRNNDILCAHMGNPTRIRYGAGRWDVEISTLPSVEVVAIVDRAPLLFSEEKPDNKYSAHIHTQLEENNGSYLTLPDLFADPKFLPAQQDEFIDKVREGYSGHRDIVLLQSGYQAAPNRIAEDSLPHVLSGILFWGGDIDTIRIGKFGDSFQTQFDLENKRKTIIFKEADIDESFNQVGSDNYFWWQHCLDNFAQGTTALVVKADWNHVSRHLMAAQPDVVVGSGTDFDFFAETLGDSYAITPIGPSNFPDEDQNWGYGKINTIQIGRRRSDPTLVYQQST